MENWTWLLLVPCVGAAYILIRLALGVFQKLKLVVAHIEGINSQVAELQNLVNAPGSFEPKVDDLHTDPVETTGTLLRLKSLATRKKAERQRRLVTRISKGRPN